LRSGVACPSDYANVILGERFSRTPWDIEEAPADRVLYYRQLLGVEADVQRETAGLPNDEPLILEGE